MNLSNKPQDPVSNRLTEFIRLNRELFSKYDDLRKQYDRLPVDNKTERQDLSRKITEIQNTIRSRRKAAKVDYGLFEIYQYVKANKEEFHKLLENDFTDRDYDVRASLRLQMLLDDDDVGS